MAIRAALIVLLLGLLAASARAETPWPEQLVNPQPLKGDLVLPMPCGGQMVFRPVLVASGGLLSDQRIALGGVDKEYGYKEYQHAGYIAGTFTAPDHPAARLYYLGKYDVTRLQFAALGPNCPLPDEQGRMPQTGITWNQAADFADAYTGWLVAHAKELTAAKRAVLPVEAGQPGFLRLPTEEEWEFAARGGTLVSDADFGAPLPPMTQPLAKYVWYDGTESANGQPQPVGLLLPNPLGLFDMLGNVRQFAFAAFRLNHLSRLSGDAGGYVVRGTDYETPEDQVRTAARDEYVPFDAQGPRRPPSVGFRLALVAPVLPDIQRLRQVRSEWATLPDRSGGALAEPVPNDPVKEAETLAAAVDDAQLKRRLQGLGAVIAADIKARDEQRGRAALAELDLASWLGERMQRDAVRVLAQVQVALIAHKQDDPEAKKLIAQRRDELRGVIAAYRDAITSLASEYPADVRTAQAAILRDQLMQRGLERQAASVQQVAADIAALRTAGALAPDAIERRLRDAICGSADGRTWQDACKAG